LGICMRVIARSTLKSFWEKHTDAKGVLETWYKTACRENWTCFNDVKRVFGSADVIAGNRVVFNIRGNTYRLIVKIHYNTGIVFIRFVGTHAEYDKIDAETI
jgi:mRNA interferase HigB